METERDRILQMVAKGTISAEEANELLQALEEPQAATAAEPVPTPEIAEQWPFLFFGGLLLSLFGAAGLARKSVRSRMAGGATFFLGLVAAGAALWSRDAVWLRVEVEEADGNELRFALPLPIGLAVEALNLARRYAPPEVGEQMEMAAVFLGEAARGDQTEPLTIETDEGGTRVRLSLG
ncbi:MAG: hypothetical protein R3272_11045 [Candidatus Promineifilaceae bacterium]|nr:hypothetical protein [Candidatus Promineifilaceae bacterium]